MTAFLRAAALAAAAMAGMSAPAAAGDAIHRACLKSGRAASAQLCGCIQQVADDYLGRRDQRLAASFFKNPQKAQEIRQSDRPAHEAFWQRYKAFGQAAGQSCKSYAS